jgi:hypothetical protein
MKPVVLNVLMVRHAENVGDRGPFGCKEEFGAPPPARGNRVHKRGVGVLESASN